MIENTLQVSTSATLLLIKKIVASAIMEREAAVKNKNSIKKFVNKNKLLNAAFHSDLFSVFLQIGHELKVFI